MVGSGGISEGLGLAPREIIEEKRRYVEEELIREYPLYFLEMNPAQERFIRVKNRFGRIPRRRIFEAGNKLGKSLIGVAEDIAWSVGYRPWLPPDDPDHKIPVKVPNTGLIACETMMHSVAEKIEPLLRLLIPKICRPAFKKGNQGVLSKVELPYGCYGEKCGSVIYIRSYDQRADSFEGIDYDGYVHWDEPPPLEIFRAVERGKVAANAPSWFTMTPLKEAWVYDMLSSKAGVVI